MAYRDAERRVKVAIPEGVEVTLDVLGVKVVARSNVDGRFTAAHRKEGIGSGDLDSMRKAIERIETEMSEKRERTRRLKEAEANPEPALLYRSGTVQPMTRRRRPGRGNGPDEAATLEPIHVRGVDQRSGLALIIRESGAKESMTWDLITRPLAGVEKKRLLDLAEKEQRAAKEIPDPVSVESVLPSIKETEVAATWDEFREVWVVKFGREELVAPVGYRSRDLLEARILARLIVKQTPYRFTDSRQQAVPLVKYADDTEWCSLATYDNLFKTEAEVKVLHDAIRRSAQTVKRREAYLKTLLFDRSIFTDA